MEKNNDYEDEEMTVELELDDGTIVNCAIVTILTVESKDYIALLPIKEEGSDEDVKYGSIVIRKIPTTPMRSLNWSTSRRTKNTKR